MPELTTVDVVILLFVAFAVGMFAGCYIMGGVYRE